MSARQIIMCMIMLAAVSLASNSAFGQTGPSSQTVRSAMNSVVEVRADCQGVKTRGTGFVWRRSDLVVTALHVVAGCSNLKIQFEEPNLSQWIDVTIVRVASQIDLV